MSRYQVSHEFVEPIQWHPTFGPENHRFFLWQAIIDDWSVLHIE
jgi:hypothetical protein